METQFVILLVSMVALVAAVYGAIHWIRTAPLSPDPWAGAVRESAGEEEPVLVCPKCLATNSPESHFCEECGFSLGACTNLSPYLYLFALGDWLRTGTSGRFIVRPLAIIGYIILPLCQFALLAPFYWFQLFKNIRRLRAHSTEAHSQA